MIGYPKWIEDSEKLDKYYENVSTEESGPVQELERKVKPTIFTLTLKGLGHAILGNFSIDQMVIELTKISKKRFKTIEELKQNTGKPRRGMDEQNWRGLRWIAFG